MNITDQFVAEYAAQIKRLWVTRTDLYSDYEVFGAGRWLENLTDDHITLHAQGKITLTLLPCGPSGCGWLFYDIDHWKIGDEAENERLAHDLFQKLGSGALLESCGIGSFHPWKFIRYPSGPITYNSAENVDSYACQLLTQVLGSGGYRSCPGSRAPKGRWDNYPGRCTTARIPGKHPKRDDYSRLWDDVSDKYVDYGTDDFLEVCKRIQPQEIDIVPIHSSSWANNKPVQQRPLIHSASTADHC